VFGSEELIPLLCYCRVLEGARVIVCTNRLNSINRLIDSSRHSFLGTASTDTTIKSQAHIIISTCKSSLPLPLSLPQTQYTAPNRNLKRSTTPSA